LARAGHAVRLATVRFAGRPLDQARLWDLQPGEAPLPLGRDVPLPEGRLGLVLAAEAQSFEATAAVGSTDLVNRELADLPPALPLWCDYFGDPMAERQMLARLHGTDHLVADQWATLIPALRRADRFSGCSRRQMGALYGQLGAVGRLNRFTASEPLVHCLEPWIESLPVTSETGPFLRGPVAPAESLIVLQTGGFNTWLDVPSLIEALHRAMRREPRLVFAATGGTIPGHDEHSFAEFQRLVAASPFRSRFFSLGWLPLDRVPRVIAEADLGLNVDRPGAEGWLGTRNRLLDWLRGGLPIVTTIGSELAEELVQAGCAHGAAQGDPASVAEAILRVLTSPAGYRERARRLASGERFEASRCLKPLLDWAANPRPAPDLQAWREQRAEPPALWLNAEASARRLAEADQAGRERDGLRRRLDALEGSRLVRVSLKLRRLLGGPRRRGNGG